MLFFVAVERFSTAIVSSGAGLLETGQQMAVAVAASWPVQSGGEGSLLMSSCEAAYPPLATGHGPDNGEQRGVWHRGSERSHDRGFSASKREVGRV